MEGTRIVGAPGVYRHWLKRQIYGVIGHMTSEQTHFRIGILVYPGCLRSGAVLPHDVLGLANTLMLARPAAERLHFEAVWLSARGKTSVAVEGLGFATETLAGQIIDALMLPGIAHQSVDDIAARLPQLAPEQAALCIYLSEPRLLLSSCSATCLLAHAGLLDGRRSTTSWWLSAYFRQQYPQVILEAEELIVQDGNLVSSGGLTSTIDLALWLIGHFGGDALRQLCAKVLLVDANRTSQAPYIASAMLENQGHVIVERARRWLNTKLDQEWNMAGLARHCHCSPRTLLRRFQEALGISPIQYVQQLRVERAKALLETTQLSLADITARCGYEDISSFSNLFKRWAQLTPKEYRQRFGLRS